MSPSADDQVGSAVTALAPLGARTATGTDSGAVWATGIGRPVKLLELPDPIVGSCPVGADVIVAAGETLAHLTATGPTTFRPSSVGQIVSVATSSAANGAMIAGGIHGLAVLDFQRSGEDQWLDTPTITSVAVANNGRLVAAGDLTGALHIVDPRTGEGTEITGYPDRIELLAWTNDSQGVVVAADDELTLWSVGDDGEAADSPRLLIGHDHPVTAIAADATGTHLASGDLTGRIAIWDLCAPGDEPVAHVDIGSRVVALGWSPDGRVLAATTASGQLVRMWPTDEA